VSEQTPGNHPPYGQQPPAYGQQPPPGGQPLHGDQPPYGGQPPSYGTFGPQGEMSPPDQRMWGMLAHLSSIVAALVLSAMTAGFVYLGAVGPLVVYLVLKERGVFVRRQAAEALNFQILLTIVYLAGVVLSVLTLGIGLIVVVPLAIVVGVVALVFTIIAAVKANQGVDYRYPINWRLVK